MAEFTDYSERVGDHFQLERPPSIIRTLKKDTHFAATRLTHDAPHHGMSQPTVPENAHVVVVQLKDFARGELWLDGRPVHQAGFKSDDISFYDLRHETRAYLESPFDSLHFYVPADLLNQVADDTGVSRISELKVALGTGIQDLTLSHLGRSLLPALDHADQLSSIFVDHVAFAFAAHLAHTYGGLPLAAPSFGGLSRDKEAKAKELLRSCINQELPLAEIAGACGLPLGRFMRAFRQTTGMSPHRWLRWQRVELAKELLGTSNLSLAQIAYTLNFVDQSHFTRVFTAWVGSTPGKWRRLRQL